MVEETATLSVEEHFEDAIELSKDHSDKVRENLVSLCNGMNELVEKGFDENKAHTLILRSMAVAMGNVMVGLHGEGVRQAQYVLYEEISDAITEILRLTNTVEEPTI